VAGAKVDEQLGSLFHFLKILVTAIRNPVFGSRGQFGGPRLLRRWGGKQAKCSQLAMDTAGKVSRAGTHPPDWRTSQRHCLLHTAIGAWLLLILACVSQSGCSKAHGPTADSPRLHLVSVLYGKYMAAHEGQMPADRDELIKFIDSSERDVIQRHGYRSGEEIFTEKADQPRVIVLYRDQRERLQTDYVAIEEQNVQVNTPEGRKNWRKWFAADSLGVPYEINQEQANRVLTEVTQGADNRKDLQSGPQVAKATLRRRAN
jgi:hypothetical protein